MGHFWILNQNTTVFLLADLIWDSIYLDQVINLDPNRKLLPCCAQSCKKLHGDNSNLHLSRFQVVDFIRRDEGEDAGLV